MTTAAMTTEGSAYRAPRSRRGLRDLPDRMSLRAKLITGLLALVIVAVAAISISSAWVLRSYLTSQDDTQLQTALHGLYSNIVSGQRTALPVPGTTYPYQRCTTSCRGPGAWNLAQPVWRSSAGCPATVGIVNWSRCRRCPRASCGRSRTTGSSSRFRPSRAPTPGGSSRTPVSYLLPTATGAEQVSGTLIVGADLGNINAVIADLAVTILIIGAIIVCILALAIVMVVRASLRPLVDIEETAGEIAAGHLNRRVPERDPRTEIGSLGRSLNTMLSQIETAFHAQEASEVAAHQSEERMRRFIADASHELRTPVTAIRGFAEYYRQRGGLVRHWDREAGDRRRRFRSCRPHG